MHCHMFEVKDINLSYLCKSCINFFVPNKILNATRAKSSSTYPNTPCCKIFFHGCYEMLVVNYTQQQLSNENELHHPFTKIFFHIYSYVPSVLVVVL